MSAVLPIDLKPYAQVVPNPSEVATTYHKMGVAERAAAEVMARKLQRAGVSLTPDVIEPHMLRAAALRGDLEPGLQSRLSQVGVSLQDNQPADLGAVQLSVTAGHAAAPDAKRYKDVRAAIQARQQLAGEIMSAMQSEIATGDYGTYDPLLRQVDKLGSCCERPVWARCECGAYHWQSAKRCSSRWCPTCAAVRSSQLSQAIWIAVNAPQPEKPSMSWIDDPDIKLLHCVFTVRNGFDLAERLKHLNKSMEKLRRKYPIYRDAVLGGTVNREVTWSPVHGWHVHAHCLLICRAWLPNRDKDRPRQDEPGGPDNMTPLQAAWLKATGDSWDISTSAIYGKDAVREVAKYATKMDELALIAQTPGYLRQLVTTLHGRRMFSTWGVLYNQVRYDETEELPEWVDPETGEVYAQPDGMADAFVCAECGSTKPPHIVEVPLVVVMASGRHIWYLRRPKPGGGVGYGPETGGGS